MKKAYVVIGFFAILALIVIVSKRPTYLPEELSGVWVTEHPDYFDRTLELSEVTMVFGTSDETVDVYFVDSVEKTVEEQLILYEVHFHRHDNEEETVAFYFSKKRGGTIRFKNQKQIDWVRK